MNRTSTICCALAVLPLVIAGLSAAAQPGPPLPISGMVWRSIGPFRGGRVAAVTGVVGQPGVYYMGMPAGGVWKTTSAGTTWYPVFDSVKEASSVGAIEVAPSDPSVIYVGMGDMITGGAINRGNGVYKSIDGGATWRHMGLEKTEHIPSIVVDPHDPNTVLLAAQGSMNARSDARGIYRSTDGGTTWTKTLALDDVTGAQKIARAFDQPNVLLATTMRYYTPPGQARGGGFGGRDQGPSGTRIFKSIDNGVTWTELKGGGLPALTGRTCVAVAMHTNAQRMFLVGNFGLYRSDNGGSTWRHMDAEDRRVANGQGGYNCGVYVNSQDPDVVYVINTCSYRSTDGGRTFTGFKGAPGGDDPQQMWLDPTDGNRLFLGTDQGATVSLDGGKTWSSWYNQATAQVYHISVDNQFPYWVYATQQDSGSIATSSRGNLGEITPLDWLPHPGYEFGSIVADPLNPKVSYAGGPGGGIIKTSYPSGQWIDVSPSIDTKLALRKVGNQPLVFSQRNPRELYAGFQCLMATADGGKRWRALSPDLTLKPGEKPPAAPAAPVRRGRRGPAGAPATGQPAAKPAEPPASPADGPANPQPGQTPRSDDDDDADRVPYDDGDKDADEEAEQQLGPRYAIESIAPSSVDANIIWAGTNNGLIKLTRDHGATWTDISIRDLPNATRADISAIDASHMDAGTAYAAVDCHASADYKPYIYRTRDFGKSWTPIVAGLPESEAGGSFVRVVRADTVRGGLIFAGTESSVYYSIDDGDHWQSLALNLPVTSYRDMVVKGNDLVVGTYGRGFWILDDISPLRQMSPSAGMGPAVLLKPAEAVRVRRNVNGDTPFPPEVPHADNPPNGAIVYYYLGGKASGEITLEVRDERGSVIRRYSSAPIPPSTDPPPPVPDFWVEKPSPLPKEPGLNRMCWDLRCESPGAFSHSYGINANPGQTPASPEGPLALPGRYTLTLTVEGKQYTQSVTVKNDPRSPASVADLRDQFALQLALYQCTRDAWNAYHQIAGVRASISAILRATPPAEVETAARALDTKLLAVGGTTGFGVRFGGGGGGGFGGAAAGPRQPTFATMNGQAVRQLNTLDSGDMAPSEAMRKAAAAVCADMDKAKKSWALLRSKDLAQFDALLAKYNLKPIGGQTAALAPERAVAR